MTEIHPTAIIESGAHIGKNVIVGPYSVVKAGVTLEDGVEIKGHVYIEGNTIVGEGTVICLLQVLERSRKIRNMVVKTPMFVLENSVS